MFYEAGEMRTFGLLEQSADSLVCQWPVQTGPDGSPEPIPQNKWHPVDLSLHVQRIHNQGRIGMCASSATSQACEIARAIAGLGYVPLSAGDLYRRVSGGIDRGSLLEDNMMQLLANGIAPESIIPYLDWRNDAAGAKDTRRHYRGLEAHFCPTVGHVVTALMQGFPCVIGYWHHFSDPVDDRGWMRRPYGGRGGHAVCAVGFVQDKAIGEGVFIVNSWTSSWGKNGYAILPLSRLEQGIRSFQAWSLRAVMLQDHKLPPLKG